MTADDIAGTPDIDFDAWRAAIRRDTLSNYHYSMGRAIAREGNRAAAIEQLRHAAAADETMVAAHVELAELLRAEGRTAEAEAAGRVAAALSSNWQAEALLRQGEELAAVNRAEEALEVLTAAAALSPAVRARAEETIADVRYARALSRKMAGDQAGTFAILREMADYDGDNPILLHDLSLCLQASGDSEQAVARAVKAAHLAPPGLRNDVVPFAAELLIRHLRLKEAETLLSGLIATGSGHVSAFSLFAYTRMVQGRMADAKRFAQRAIAFDPANPSGCLILGCLLAATNDSGAAEAVFRRILRCAPEHLVAQAELAVLLADIGRRDEAVAMVDAIRSRLPQNFPVPVVAVPQAIVHAVAGQHDAACAALRTAMAVTPRAEHGLFQVRARLHPCHEEALTMLFAEVGLELPRSPAEGGRV